MTSPDNKQLNTHCYDSDQKPIVFDQKPFAPSLDQKPFPDFCIGSSNGTLDSSNSIMPGLSSQAGTPQPNNPYYPTSTAALNGNPYFYPFNNLPYPTNNSTPQSAPYHFPQTSTSPESRLFMHLSLHEPLTLV